MAEQDLAKRIEHAKQELERMIDLNPQGMMLVDSRGIVRRANRAMLALLGLGSFHGVLGHPLAKIIPAQGPTSDIMRCLRSEYPAPSVEREISAGEGLTRLIRFTAVCPGSPAEMSIVLAADVTEDQANAENLARRQKQEAMTSLMGALMHHINQPLTVILLQTHLLQLTLNKPDADRSALQQGLNQIGDLAQQIAAILQRAEHPADVATETYLGNSRILDLDRAAGLAIHKALDRLLDALELHEPGAMEHGHHTAELAMRLAGAMEFDADEIAVIRRGARYHDLGKLGIAGHIVRKPAPLTPDEMAQMKHHSAIGRDIIRGFPGMDREAELAYTHHEWYDGTGYPRGLKGEAIPMAAATVSVADAYDAMRYLRSYHAPMSHADILADIIKCAGTRFDPRVVDALKNLPPAG